MPETEPTRWKRISSPVAFPLKMTFVSMILGAGIGSPIAEFLQNGLNWWFIFYPLIGAVVFPMLQTFYCLKKVEMNSAGIRVSSLRRKIQIPFESIATGEVRHARGFMLVTLQLTAPSAVGERITFVPAMGISVSDNPDLLLLQERASIRFKDLGAWGFLSSSVTKPIQKSQSKKIGSSWN